MTPYGQPAFFMPGKGLLIVLLLSLSVFAVSGNVWSEIYTWTDEHGNTHFGDRAPTGVQASPVELAKINTFKSVSVDILKDLENARGSVVMYSAVWCGVCKKARQYFSRQGIPFREYDIEKTAKGRSDFKKLNGRGVPVILVGKQRMNGFSVRRFESLYGG